jgi:small nuclear ribonucleoprotein (snRNP)-like protein
MDSADMDNPKATEYLEALLNKKLRVYTNDSRMFLGDLKCTDNVSQIVREQLLLHIISLIPSRSAT